MGGCLGRAIGEAYEGVNRIRVISKEITELSHGGDAAETGVVDLKQVLESAIRMAEPEVQHRASVVRERRRV